MLNTCKVCGAKDEVTLHHLTYERLGNERDDDLIPLCWTHHGSFHLLIGGSKKNMQAETDHFIQAARFDEEANSILRSF